MRAFMQSGVHRRLWLLATGVPPKQDSLDQDCEGAGERGRSQLRT